MALKRGSTRDPLWYKDAIIYELPVKSFYDANEDGIGDFRGVIQKLDYLQELGVTCLWLLPFFPSPLRDDGYDISDYTSIHPSYGTLDDFKEFMREAQARRLQVVIELVEWADVFVVNTPHHARKHLGLEYEDISALNPRRRVGASVRLPIDVHELNSGLP